MVWRVRRVVTGHDKNGKSMFLTDGPAPNVKEMASMPGLALTDLWVTTGSPADNRGSADAADRPIVLEPPANGSILRIVEFPPDAAWRNTADSKAAFDSIGAGHAKDGSTSDPMMHTTATVDYLIILKGEIVAIMENGETLLRPGDIMIQRGTNHSWSVRGNKPCVLAAILINARPLGLAAAHAKAAAKKAVRTAARKAAKTAAKKGARKPAKQPAASKKAVKPAPAKKAVKRVLKAAAKKTVQKPARKL